MFDVRAPSDGLVGLRRILSGAMVRIEPSATGVA